MEYQLFARDRVFAVIQTFEASAQSDIFAAFDSLKANPFQEGDYHEDGPYAGPELAKIVGPFAIIYYVDHAVKEVKILDLLLSDEET